ncbi:pre-mRNA-splicing factor CEF1, putative [Babesia caballi]|uniref:Pre-mRNA-splicing factor CEF1, putative n=1 Tax=Babesia caballi TaxID=5871 RepID=A0AAV4LV94_BABCB|nr:pre-mRNA-splicing factor CEF1, putative [Babesia caballi]
MAYGVQARGKAESTSSIHSHYSPVFTKKPGGLWRSSPRGNGEGASAEATPARSAVDGNRSKEETRRRGAATDRSPDSRVKWLDSNSVNSYRSAAPLMGVGGTAPSANAATTRPTYMSDKSGRQHNRSRDVAARSSGSRFYAASQRNRDPEWLFSGEDPFESDDDGSAVYNVRRAANPARSAPTVRVVASSECCFASSELRSWAPRRAGKERASQLSSTTRSTAASVTREEDASVTGQTSISGQMRLGMQRIKSYFQAAVEKIRNSLAHMCSGSGRAAIPVNCTKVRRGSCNEPLLKSDTYSRSFDLGR